MFGYLFQVAVFLMYRVELKELSNLRSGREKARFLMYRVELKDLTGLYTLLSFLSS